MGGYQFCKGLSLFGNIGQYWRGLQNVGRVGGFLACFDSYYALMFIAKHDVDEILRSDCHPYALAVVAANDNFKKADPGEIPLNAEESCRVIQTALECYGVMVIPIVNRNLKYFRAVLRYLRNGGRIPKSCKLFWFIFTGHGRAHQFCMNEEYMRFNDFIIQHAFGIEIENMLFFFECCQEEGEKIEVVNVEKQYMCLYSCPPNKQSFHFGVGPLMTCIAEILKPDYKKSLNDFQSELRTRYLEMTARKLHICMRDRRPVYTTNMIDEIVLYEEIRSASKWIR